MKNHIYSRFIILLLLSLTLLTSCQQSIEPLPASPPMVKEGFIDFSNWNFEQHRSVQLMGDWNIYWKQLVEPDDVAKDDKLLPTGTIQVPSFWNGVWVRNQQLTGKGYATYQLTIKFNSNDVRSVKALRIPYGVKSAYKVWVNGQLLAESGTPGGTASEEKAKLLPQIVVFQPKEETIILMQVSNYVQRTGGILNSFELGNEKAIIGSWVKQIALELFVIGSLLIMGVYHLGLYIMRRKDQAPLFFGILCLLVGLRALFLGEAFIYHLVPNIPWELFKKSDFIGQFLAPSIFILYIHALFPLEAKRLFGWLSILPAFLFCIITLITPSNVYSNILPAFQIFLILHVPYIGYLFVKATKHKREGALFGSIMFFLLALTIINDVLYYNQIIQTRDLAKLGLFLFIFAQAFILSIKYSNSFRSVEILSMKQARWQEELEQTVEERTQELIKTQKTLIESEKMAALGHLVAGVAHEINTPVGIGVTAVSYLEDKAKEFESSLQSNKMKKSDLVSFIHKVNESTKIIKGNLVRASNLVRSFKQVAVDQNDNEFRKFNLKEYIAEILLHLEPQLKRLNASIVVHGQDNIVINSSPGALSQIITNFIMNSFKHGFVDENKEYKITISINLENEKLFLTYNDNGAGMKPEVVEKMYDPFFTTNRENGGTGLGMNIVYNLVTQSLGGSIECESEVGVGTTFYLIVPLSNE